MSISDELEVDLFYSIFVISIDKISDNLRGGLGLLELLFLLLVVVIFLVSKWLEGSGPRRAHHLIWAILSHCLSSVIGLQRIDPLFRKERCLRLLLLAAQECVFQVFRRLGATNRNRFVLFHLHCWVALAWFSTRWFAVTIVKLHVVVADWMHVTSTD